MPGAPGLTGWNVHPRTAGSVGSAGPDRPAAGSLAAHPRPRLEEEARATAPQAEAEKAPSAHSRALLRWSRRGAPPAVLPTSVGYP